MVSHISEGYAKLFRNEGSRTDKHVREHDIYSVGYTKADDEAIRSPAERARFQPREGMRQQATATMATGTGGLLAAIDPWLNNRTIAYGTATLSVGAFALAVLLNFLGQGDVPAAPVTHEAQTAPKKSQTAAKTEARRHFRISKGGREKTQPQRAKTAARDEALREKKFRIANLVRKRKNRRPPSRSAPG